MNYRVLIFDDQQEIRQLLWSLFDNRGYEVFTFPNPALCPLSDALHCPCPIEHACSDVIISDVNMPFKNGLDFIEEQIKKGCRCKNIALMSGAFTNGHITKAKSLGLTIFKKPFQLSDLNNWMDPERKLSDWFLKNLQKE